MYIYKTTNSVNNKIYIGQSTHNSLNSLNYYGSGVLIGKAINKYGIDNFSKEILEDGIDDIEVLNEREIFWIKELNSTDLNIGYNISSGGKGNLGIKMQKITKEKLRAANLGKKQSSETISKRQSKIKGLKRSEYTCNLISSSLKKLYSDPINHPMYGKQNSHTLETKKKISDSKKGKHLSEDHKRNISIANKGKQKYIISEETRKKLSKSHLGKTFSKETKTKMSESHKKPQSKIQCDRCGKIGGNSMRRWHFENCKK